jgi:hypothetical protein
MSEPVGGVDLHVYPTVKAAGAADAVYRALSDLAVIGLVEHIRDLHRELGDLKGEECPFVSAVFRRRSEP